MRANLGLPFLFACWACGARQATNTAIPSLNTASVAASKLSPPLALGAEPFASTSAERPDQRSAPPLVRITAIEALKKPEFHGCSWNGGNRDELPLSFVAQPTLSGKDLTIRNAERVEVTFDDGASSLAYVQAEVQGFSLRGMMPANRVSLFLQKPIRYLDIFLPKTALFVSGYDERSVSVQVALDIGVHVRKPGLWVLPCEALGLRSGDFVEPSHASRGLALLRSGWLSSTPSGSPLMALPTNKIVHIASSADGVSLVFWDSPLGQYRGFVKNTELVPQNSWSGGSFTTRPPAMRTGAAGCTPTRTLYIRADREQWRIAGEVNAGRLITWMQDTLFQLPEGGVIRPIVAPSNIELPKGYLLAVAPVDGCPEP
jgi:hypothetical protein